MRAWPYRIHVDSMAIKAYDDKDTVDLEGLDGVDWLLCVEMTEATGAEKQGYERRHNDRV